MRLRSVSATHFCVCICVAHVSFLVSVSRKHMGYFTTEHHSLSGDLGQFTNNYATWTVSIPAGWTVVISVEDDSYDEAWSQPVRI